ncbi:DUF6069 family protein [Nocardioides sp. TF02-7]|uniref:DUF6069 family protein n=1 Tax=Nocardioides sp. TF02-7 TaxID=2917724 RepID=UPI001F06D56B|nr:DUF6069 family protein [Nocardioides sp. TF02-7]UMG94115.1 DUF6069 family protein [Nocardioides sp. TF02-7]
MTRMNRMTSTHHDRVETSSRPRTRTRRRVTARYVYLFLALEVLAILLWVFWQLLGVDLEVRSGAGRREVTLTAILLTTALASAASYALLWASRGRDLKVWTAVATTVLVVSCSGPLLATSASAGAALLGFHLLVGVGLIGGVRRLDRAAAEPPTQEGTT